MAILDKTLEKFTVNVIQRLKRQECNLENHHIAITCTWVAILYMIHVVCLPAYDCCMLIPSCDWFGLFTLEDKTLKHNLT